MQTVIKPVSRSLFRHYMSKEYFIVKRKLNWMFGNTKWSVQACSDLEGYSFFSHKSVILRPLKDVEMYLQENKRTNLKLAIDKIHNTVIKPNETFSFWKQVGRPSKMKGYLDGLVLSRGIIQKGTGGGLCQLGNLLFWIFAHSPLSIKERHRHSYDVFPDLNRDIPFGAGATLSYNYVDLQIKNETTDQFQIKLWLDDTFLNGELISSAKPSSFFSVVERNHIVKQQIWGGYTRHNQIVKIETFKNGDTKETLLAENHAIMMYAPFLSEKTTVNNET